MQLEIERANFETDELILKAAAAKGSGVGIGARIGNGRALIWYVIFLATMLQ